MKPVSKNRFITETGSNKPVRKWNRFNKKLVLEPVYEAGLTALVESELPKVLFENLKPILSITAEEACNKCEDVLTSGIALAKSTIFIKSKIVKNVLLHLNDSINCLAK
jgi:hypothetical protein